MTTTDLAIRPLTLPTLADRINYAQQMASSGLVPREFRNTPANVFYAIEYGAMLGLGPMAALTGIHIIEGKPSASASLVSALVRSAGHRLRTGYDPAKGIGWAEIVRSDDPTFTFRAQWDVQRAVDAGLCEIKAGKVIQRSRDGKAGSWEKYTIAMQKHRAVTEVARDACEEALFGLHYTPEELGADVNEDGIPVQGSAQRVESYAEVPDAVAPVVAEFRGKALAATTAAELRELHTAAGAVGLSGMEPTTDAEGVQCTLKSLIAARGAILAAEEATRNAAPVDAEVVDPAATGTAATGTTTAAATDTAPVVPDPVEDVEPITALHVTGIRARLAQLGVTKAGQQCLIVANLLAAPIPGGQLANLTALQGARLMEILGSDGVDSIVDELRKAAE